MLCPKMTMGTAGNSCFMTAVGLSCCFLGLINIIMTQSKHNHLPMTTLINIINVLTWYYQKDEKNLSSHFRDKKISCKHTLLHENKSIHKFPNFTVFIYHTLQWKHLFLSSRIIESNVLQPLPQCYIPKVPIKRLYLCSGKSVAMSLKCNGGQRDF